MCSNVKYLMILKLHGTIYPAPSPRIGSECTHQRLITMHPRIGELTSI